MDARDAGAVPTRRRRPGGHAPAAADAAELKVTDLRQPGWSWGWDTLAREFAALLQLKGVGLYFTYATYTDNRPNSPYRGSSYTGVDALAEFTGESADDVRTVNKLLAALGLARFQTYTVHTRGKDGRRGTRNRLHCYILERDPHLQLEDVLGEDDGVVGRRHAMTGLGPVRVVESGLERLLPAGREKEQGGEVK